MGRADVFGDELFQHLANHREAYCHAQIVARQHVLSWCERAFTIYFRGGTKWVSVGVDANMRCVNCRHELGVTWTTIFCCDCNSRCVLCLRSALSACFLGSKVNMRLFNHVQDWEHRTSSFVLAVLAGLRTMLIFDSWVATKWLSFCVMMWTFIHCERVVERTLFTGTNHSTFSHVWKSSDKRPCFLLLFFEQWWRRTVWGFAFASLWFAKLHIPSARKQEPCLQWTVKCGLWIVICAPRIKKRYLCTMSWEIWIVNFWLKSSPCTFLEGFWNLLGPL